MKRFSLTKIPVENKTVLVRTDYNVPLEKEKVTDNNKIIKSLPTIKYLLQKNCKIIIATHLGRPKGKAVSDFKVNPLAKELEKLLPKTLHSLFLFFPPIQTSILFNPLLPIK